MPNLTPEQEARENIDRMLEEAAWVVQNKKDANLGAAEGVAIREYPTDSGPADYMLFVNRKPVGVIEAKKAGTILRSAEEQSTKYATSTPKHFKDGTLLPFVYESTGVVTHFRDFRDPKPRSREVFHFHRPETFRERLKDDFSLRRRLLDIPELTTDGLRLCQITAIENIEKSFKQNRPRALVQMATGSGKTFTAITFVYRLLRFARARRILFLVDTRNLGEQAEGEFKAYKPSDDTRLFTELYTVQRLQSSFIDPSAQVCISTIQRMYSILRGEKADEDIDAVSMYEQKWKRDEPLEVAYNPDVPIEEFDFIIIDECHRSIYNLWKQVLDYFDAFLIGLTATPDKRTFGFFHENVVSEYRHEEAVADGVNVGYDTYLIETEITKNGAEIRAGEFVDKRDRLTREKRWTMLDEQVEYDRSDLDKTIVSESQIRHVIKTYRDKLPTEIFPGREEVPKTLIFAKTDSHADDIIRIVLEEFGEGSEFCKKITYNVDAEKPSEILQQFRTAYNPRIAVTVDMIATGTDVKPIEVLLFMRDVRSRSYFEQMKGRGTRTLGVDDLRKVTPSAHANKSHFMIVDAVGVTKSIKTDSRPLERKPTVPMKDLLEAVHMGVRDEDTVTSLANRLTRLEKQISPDERHEFEKLAGGRNVNAVVKDLLAAYDPDRAIETARGMFDLTDTQKPSEEQLSAAHDALSARACEPFDSPDLRKYVEEVRRSYEQIIDVVNLDRVIFAGYDKDAAQNAEKTIERFRQFLEDNKDEILALRIFYDQPYRRRELTYEMIRELNDALARGPYLLTTEAVWDAIARLRANRVKGAGAKRMLTDIISLIRFELGEDTQLQPFSDHVNARFKDWVFEQNRRRPENFTEEQMEWLRMIRDHVTTSVQIEVEDFDNTPFAERGGLGQAYDLFGKELPEILSDINMGLVA